MYAPGKQRRQLRQWTHPSPTKFPCRSVSHPCPLSTFLNAAFLDKETGLGECTLRPISNSHHFKCNFDIWCEYNTMKAFFNDHCKATHIPHTCINSKKYSEELKRLPEKRFSQWLIQEMRHCTWSPEIEETLKGPDFVPCRAPCPQGRVTIAACSQNSAYSNHTTEEISAETEVMGAKLIALSQNRLLFCLWWEFLWVPWVSAYSGRSFLYR